MEYVFNVGDNFQENFVVTKKIYQGFIHIFNDKNCLHTDQNYAVLKGYKSVVMHGNILNGFISYFIGECLPIKNIIIHSQEIIYSEPIYLNNRLDFFVQVVDVILSVNVVVLKFFFQNEKGVKVAKGKIQIGVLY